MIMIRSSGVRVILPTCAFDGPQSRERADKSTTYDCTYTQYASIREKNHPQQKENENSAILQKNS